MEPWNTRAFFEAADVSDVARCLQSGADLAARGASGWTPLHYAASVGIPEIVTVLLEAGADLEARAEDGQTPLHYASRAAFSETATAVVAALLEGGADLEARDAFGCTPLHYAARAELPGTATVVAALLEGGADPNARDNDDKRPFVYAEDNEQLKGTDVYWKLNDARFPRALLHGSGRRWNSPRSMQQRYSIPSFSAIGPRLRTASFIAVLDGPFLQELLALR